MGFVPDISVKSFSVVKRSAEQLIYCAIFIIVSVEQILHQDLQKQERQAEALQQTPELFNTPVVKIKTISCND